jgi:hypothetical protein
MEVQRSERLKWRDFGRQAVTSDETRHMHRPAIGIPIETENHEPLSLDANKLSGTCDAGEAESDMPAELEASPRSQWSRVKIIARKVKNDMKLQAKTGVRALESVVRENIQEEEKLATENPAIETLAAKRFATSKADRLPLPDAWTHPLTHGKFVVRQRMEFGIFISLILRMEQERGRKMESGRTLLEVLGMSVL